MAPSAPGPVRAAALAAAALAAAAAASSPAAFRAPPARPPTSASTAAAAARRDTSLGANRHNRFVPPFPFPFDPYFNPFFGAWDRPFFPNGPPFRDGPFGQRRIDPRYSAPLDVEAEVVPEADELEEEEEEEWTTDRERARSRRSGGRREGDRGEAVGFDPPLKRAAAYPSDLYEDERFQGKKPGQAVNGEGRRPRPPRGDPGDGPRARRMNDPREQHVILDDYDDFMNDLFQRRPAPPPHRPPPRRPGPSAYTREEEDLIEAMGGRGGPRSTQEFAGLGTMTKDRGAHPGGGPADPQQRNYNPEQDHAPEGPRAGGPGFREGGFLGDSTLAEISMDYGVPVTYLADVLASWGSPVPIDPAARLGDLATGEHVFAMLEAIHTLDIAELHARYSEDALIDLCDLYDIDLRDAFEFCVEGRGWALPFGVRTFLRVEQEEELLDALGGGGAY